MTVEKIETILINKEVSSLDNLPKNARVILVVGEAGVGKTHTIHTFLNLYEKKLSLKDTNRFQLSGTQTDTGSFKYTDQVQAYIISNPEDKDAPLVFIDTPPLESSSKNETAIINYLQQQKLGIDAILLTIRNSMSRKGAEEKALISSVKKLKDNYLTGNSLFIGATFSDATLPPCTDWLCEALDVDKEVIFPFNNTPLKEEVMTPGWEDFPRIYWERSNKTVTDLSKKLLALPQNSKVKIKSEVLNKPSINPAAPKLAASAAPIASQSVVNKPLDAGKKANPSLVSTQSDTTEEASESGATANTILINREVNSLAALPKNARIILVVGGTGKTSTIQTFLNMYENNLSLDAPHRFQLSGTQKKEIPQFSGDIPQFVGPFEKTNKIQAYMISNPEDDEAPLVFIDTPSIEGSSDSYQETICNYLKEQKSGIDGILVTIPSYTSRMGPDEKRVFNLVQDLKSRHLTGNSLFVASTSSTDFAGLQCRTAVYNSFGTKGDGIFEFNNISWMGASKNPATYRMQCSDWKKMRESATRLAKKLLALPQNSRNINYLNLETSPASLLSPEPRNEISSPALVPTPEPRNETSSPATVPTPEPRSETSSPATVPTPEPRNETSSPALVLAPEPRNEPSYPATVPTPLKTEKEPSSKTLPPQNKPTQKPALSNLNMTILNGFIAVLGIAMIAIAFTVLNAATGGVAGVALAAVGACTLLLGVGLFFKNRAQVKQPDLNENLSVPPQSSI